MIDMANATGKTSDATKYTQRLNELLPQFSPNYRNTSTKLFGKTQLEVQSVTSAVLSVPGVVPATDAQELLKGLSANVDMYNGHLTYGSVGVQHLMWQLSSNGYHDQALQMMLKRDFPSYGHWLALGATTAWEDWSGFADPTHPPPPTHNHIFLAGASSEWMYRAMGGIEPLGNGYGKVLIHPRVSATGIGPSSASFTVMTTRGTAACSWTSYQSGSVSLSMVATVPAATDGVVRVPLVGLKAGNATVREGGLDVWVNGVPSLPLPTGLLSARSTGDGDAIEFVALPGSYDFQVVKPGQ